MTLEDVSAKLKNITMRFKTNQDGREIETVNELATKGN